MDEYPLYKCLYILNKRPAYIQFEYISTAEKLRIHSVEKQFGYSFKVQVLAVIHLNTQLKVHVDLVHIIFPQTEFSNTFHKYRSIKHSSKQSNKVAHKIHSI